MTIVNANRVRENTTGNGTGALALLGAVTNFQTFLSGVGNGNQCYYAITHQSKNEWEVGLGTFTLSAGIPYLSRNTVYNSSNGNLLVDFTSGTKQCAVIFPGTQIDTIASNVGVAAGYANDANTYAQLASVAAVNANIYRVSAAAEASLAGTYAAAASVSYVDAASAAAQAASLAAQISSVAVEASNAAVAASMAQVYKTSASAYATEAGGYASVAQIYKVSASAFATDAANQASIAGVYKASASAFATSAAAEASAAAVSRAQASAFATNANDSASAALVYRNSAVAAASAAAVDASLALIYRTSASAYATQAADSASLAAYYAGLVNPSAYALLSSTNTFTGANTFTSLVNIRGATSLASTLVVAASTASNAVRITQTGTGNALVVEDSTNPDATPFVIDSVGVVINGATTPKSSRISTTSITPGMQQVGGTNNSSNIGIFGFNSNPGLLIAKSNGTEAAPTAVASGNFIARISGAGFDGTNYTEAGSIRIEVDGTPGTDDMPGRLVFSTTPDGSWIPTERMRITSGGLVGIGTSSPNSNAVLTNNGNIAIAAPTRNQATSNQVGVWTSDDPADNGRAAITIGTVAGGASSNSYISFTTNNYGVDRAERMRIDSSGNVGIGTSSPTAAIPLTILSNSGNAIAQNIRGRSDGIGVLLFSDNSDVENGRLDFRTNYAEIKQARNAPLVLSTNATERMRIDSSGNVGIATASPSSFGKFAVQGASTTRAFYADALAQPVARYDDNSYVSNGLTIRNTGVAGSNQGIGLLFQLGAGGTAVDSGAIQMRSEADYSTAANQDAAMAFFTAANGTNSERMRIDSSGNVGIGTSSPSYRLQTLRSAGTQSPSALTRGAVLATTYTRSDNSDFVGRQIGIGVTEYASFIQAEDTSLNVAFLALNPNGGNVGIGTSSPGSPLQVVGAARFGASSSASTGACAIYNDGNNATIEVFAGNNSATKRDLLLQTYGGNVGIGTASPGQKLTVAGTVESTSGGFKFPDGTTQSSAASGGVLTGTILDYGGITAPSGYLFCDGSAVSRTTYATLWATLNASSTVTITIASPGVVTWNAHPLSNGDGIRLQTTGALPTGLTANTTYYVINKATNTFQLSTSRGGTAINTSGTQSGTHTAIFAPWGFGDNSTTFNVPDLRGRAGVGRDDMGGSAASRITTAGSGISGVSLGDAGGTQTHTLTTAQLAAHTHSMDVVPITASGVGGCSTIAVGGANTTGSTGGGNAHQNTQPSAIVNKIIKT